MHGYCGNYLSIADFPEFFVDGQMLMDDLIAMALGPSDCRVD